MGGPDVGSCGMGSPAIGSCGMGDPAVRSCGMGQARDGSGRWRTRMHVLQTGKKAKRFKVLSYSRVLLVHLQQIED